LRTAAPGEREALEEVGESWAALKLPGQLKLLEVGAVTVVLLDGNTVTGDS